jgi:DHA1 family multidrug resistance protein-like MFS transporter
MDEKFTMGQGRLLPAPLPDLENYVVDFDGDDDPSHPYNWPFAVKYTHIIHQTIGKLLIRFILLEFILVYWSA